ncbi:hypothetical protein ZIOFF_033969 [Zingiber officinale]|uniref:Calcium uniporter protein C-terminal domain-containing protein n=1 Tax=Zingiber officinale TaxID=94328 RepID=A0A8J5L7T6_ZINOF|nr:hypothetical protein ZIOFF_033969 [Zingiber officinale]
MTIAEAKRVMRLVNVEALKRKLEREGEEVIGYGQLLKECEGMGVARSREEADAFARALDEAGVVLLFRDKVYLHPDKVTLRNLSFLVLLLKLKLYMLMLAELNNSKLKFLQIVELVRRAVPLALTPEDDPRREELDQLQKKKEEIDALAHKQVRRILWSGLGFLIAQIGLFFRLTFWEFSWDVMEPIAFFSTTAGLIAGYGYFLITSRDPTYQDLLKRLFLSRQRKLIQKQRFDIERYTELQKHCKNPWEKMTMTENIRLQHS